MNFKNNIPPVIFIEQKLKGLVGKLMQNPECYATKHCSKIERKNREREKMW